MKPFKQLRGQRVLLELPKVVAKSIYLDEKTLKSVMEQSVKDMMKLKVYAVGSTVSDVKEGDVVKLDNIPMYLHNIIDLGNDLSVIQVNVVDIAIIW